MSQPQRHVEPAFRWLYGPAEGFVCPVCGVPSRVKIPGRCSSCMFTDHVPPDERENLTSRRSSE